PVSLLRNPAKSYEVLKKTVTPEVVAAYKADKSKKPKDLKSIGLLPRISPLWDLRLLFSLDFFLRFGICTLHLELEGTLVYHCKYLAAKYGEEFRNDINRR